MRRMHTVSTHCYFLWALERFVRRAVTYLVVLPIMLILYPFTAIGNLAMEMFYRWRD
jgi:hypothetical protein